MADEALYEFMTQLNRCYVQLAVGHITEAKRISLDCVKLLNGASKTKAAEDTKQLIDQCSIYILDLYDKITKQTPLTTKQKFLWLNSRLEDNFYYPQIALGNDIVSSSQAFINTNSNLAEDLPLPPNLEAKFEELDISEWSTDIEDLTALYQDLLSNCSFVSSFLSIVNSGKGRLLFDIIEPKRESKLYAVVLHFNGCKRVIHVNNQLPILKEKSRHLTIRSLTNEDLLWPALIEKAYLKASGNGYNIDGSNMAFDTYTLTGWIPEIYKIIDGRLPREVLKLVEHFNNKKILMGIGTGKISKALSEIVGLISHHDYMIESYNEDKMILKNSWIADANQKRFIDVTSMELFQFNYLYVNWDPSTFKYSTAVNFVYNYKENSSFCLFLRSQYSVNNKTATKQEVWVLLERFKQAELRADPIMDMDIFQTESGERVIFPQQYPQVHHGEGTNGRFRLVKFVLEPHASYTIVVNCTVATSMALTMYHDISPDCELTKSFQAFPDPKIVHDEWDYLNAGGPHELSTYIRNPQFNLEIKETSSVIVSLITTELNIPVTFQMFYSETSEANKSLRAFEPSSLIYNGEYTPHHQANTFDDLQPGNYRIVCSCQEAGFRQNFSLLVFHKKGTEGFSLKKIPDSLGLFQDNIRYDWNGTTRYKLRFSTLEYNCRITFHLQHANNNFSKPLSTSSVRPMVRGSIFNAVTSKPICINEKWDNSVHGIFVDCTLVQTGSYILLVERFEPGQGTLSVDIGSSGRINLS